MHLRSISITASVLAATASAQAPVNRFAIWPDALTATSRGTLLGAPGELLQGVPATHFRGVGDDGAACRFASATYTTQDEDAATQETYRVVVRGAASGGGPDASASGILFQSGPLQTPMSSGRQAWTVTATFATPVTLPCNADFFMGLSLAANLNWSIDGQSLHIASYAWLGGSFPTTGDNPRTGAPNHAYDVTASGTVRQPSPARVLNFGLDTSAAVLNMGNVDNVTAPAPAPMGISFGAGGMYPAIKEMARDDGLTSRIRNASHAGGSAYLLLAGAAAANGTPLPPFRGSIWLRGPTLLLVGNANLDTNGVAQIPVLSPGRIPARVKGFTVYFQGVTTDSGLTTLHLTNLAGVSL